MPEEIGDRKQKCLAVARHPLYIKRFCHDQMRIENRINHMKRKKLYALARTKDVQALGLLVSVN